MFSATFVVYLWQLEDGAAPAPPEGQPVSFHPIWDYLLTSDFSAFDGSVTRVIPVTVT